MPNTPSLRFPEFNGEWREVKLGEIGSLLNGLTYSPKNITEDGLLVLRSSNIQNEQISLDDNVYVDMEVSEKSLTKENDILICVRNGSKRLIGKNVIIPKNIPKATHGAFMTVFRSPSNRFLSHWFQSKKYYKQVHRNLGATINSINNSDLKKFRLSIPSLPEQQKIADFLTAIDEKITLTTDKISQLETYKRGMMQKLLSGALRFPGFSGEWREVKLGEIAGISTGKLDANAMIEDGKYRFYTCAKDFYLIDTYAFDTEALLISGNGANVGYIHYYKGKFNAYQRTYVLDNFSENIIFVQYFLNQMLQKRISVERKDGNTPYIVKSTLSDMIIHIPKKNEQQKIANFLTSLDDKLTLEKEKLDQLKRYKQGLLQRMFV